MKRKNIVLIIATILVVTSFVLKQFLPVTASSPTLGDYHLVTAIFMIITALLAGFGIVKKAIGALRYKIISIDLLVSIAAIGALIIGEFWEAAAVTFLFVFGDFLETKTLEKTRNSIEAILKLAPTSVLVLRDNIEVEVDPDDVEIGDKVIVKPGDKIAVDGKVIEGTASVNTAAISGESIPLSKTVNDEVISGSVLENGYLIIEATKVGEDTTFARILSLVEEAQDKKAKTQKFMEKFAKWYTPAIILLAIAIGLIFWDVKMGLTLLVIACPGALVISVPVSIVAGIGNSAKHNIVIKGGDIMERIGKTKSVAFDKTGTLTYGKPEVVAINVFQGDEASFLRLATIGEKYSEHPLASAIIKYSEEKLGSVNETPTNTEIITGHGLTFTYNEETYFLGNKKLILLNNINLDIEQETITKLDNEGYTLVFLASKNGLIGTLSLFDTLREDTKDLVSNLKRSGIKKTIMLTGDNEKAAEHIAKDVGLDAYYAHLLPEDKVRLVGELKESDGPLLMVGDGVNDAPALATADVSVAMGLNGTNVAVETADVILLSDDLRKLDHAINISKKTVFNMKTNITIALITVFVLLLGVVLKVVDLAIGMLVHELSVLVVIINAMRLLRYKGRRKKKHE
ncbi:MAG: cation-translocating P-type ATPase [Bacilli bacterium]|nr:cation-translocating P-type ATPase [Bacilli bacterium]